jgi:DNA ligase-1
MLFDALATVSRTLGATRSRTLKRAALKGLLSTLDPTEIASAVGFLVADIEGGPTGLGPHLLADLARVPAALEPALEIRDVQAELDALRLLSAQPRYAAAAALFARLTTEERTFLSASLRGALRQGSLDGVMQGALADVAGRPEAEVRRVVMLEGGTRAAATLLLGDGGARTTVPQLVLQRPLSPMLAGSADTLQDALGEIPHAQVEWKIDGVRAQIHRSREGCRVYSRQGNELGQGTPEVVAALSAVAGGDFVIDAELVLVDERGRALPFQATFSAVSSGRRAPGTRLAIMAFDCLYNEPDGALIDRPLHERVAVLERLLPASLLVPRLSLPNAAAADAHYQAALALGHEGVMVKSLHSPYAAGARGRAWLKVKKYHSVDLVILAAEWGSGRRQGRLSNLHLGARQADGAFCMVGKTFKGLTDAMLAFQTGALLDLETERTPFEVQVRPELVVEVRFGDVQRSSRYPGGVALRFARVLRHRPDKSADECTSLDALVALAPEHVAGTGRATASAKAQHDARQLTLFDAGKAVE